MIFLAVTVDPERDTVEKLYTYSQQQRMLDRWRFLRGERQILQSIWDYYWIGAIAKEAAGSAAYASRLREAEQAASDTGATQSSPGPYTVQQTAPVHLIDQQGKVRVADGNAFRPAKLAHDIELLLKRGGPVKTADSTRAKLQ